MRAGGQVGRVFKLSGVLASACFHAFAETPDISPAFGFYTLQRFEFVPF
jgi:hypothetical protein